MIGLCGVSKPGGEDRPLAGLIDLERLPAHVAIIMDGNGRRARGRALPPVAGRRELPVLIENGIRRHAMVCLDALPAPVRGPLKAAIAGTSDNASMKLNLAIDYDGTSDLADAVNSIVDDARLSGTLARLRVDEDIVAARLHTAGLPDPMTGRGK